MFSPQKRKHNIEKIFSMDPWNFTHEKNDHVDTCSSESCEFLLWRFIVFISSIGNKKKAKEKGIHIRHSTIKPQSTYQILMSLFNG